MVEAGDGKMVMVEADGLLLNVNIAMILTPDCQRINMKGGLWTFHIGLDMILSCHGFLFIGAVDIWMYKS